MAMNQVHAALELFQRQWQQELEARRRQQDGRGVVQQPLAQQPRANGEQQQQHHRGHKQQYELQLRSSTVGPFPVGVVDCSLRDTSPPEAEEESRPFPVSSLPDELLLRVLSFLSASSLCSASRTCRHWHALAREPRLWRSLCSEQWSQDYLLASTLAQLYADSWFRMRSRRPVLRLDGVYCAKVSYVRKGVAEWTFNTPVHSVVYYRYLRFLDDGRALWCTSFDQPYRRRDSDDDGDEGEEPVVNPYLHGSVKWLMQAGRVGAKLPRAAVLGGVYCAAGTSDGLVSVAVRCAQNVSTFEMTMRLHRSRRRHLLQWLEYGQTMDAGGGRHEMHVAVNEAPVFLFVEDKHLR